MKIIMVASGKGGTGKTTTTAMLGRALSRHCKVALLDLDVTGPNLAGMLGIDHSDALFDEDGFYPSAVDNMEVFSTSFLLPKGVAVAWSGDKRRELIHDLFLHVHWNNPDVLLCDAPPGTGDEIKALLLYAPRIDGVVVVANSTRESVDDALRLCNLLRTERYRKNVNILGIILNMEYYETTGGEKLPIFAGDVDVGAELELPILARVPFIPAVHRVLVPLHYYDYTVAAIRGVLQPAEAQGVQDGGK